MKLLECRVAALLAMTITGFSSPVHALKIANCDDVAHTVLVAFPGGNTDEVMLEPGQHKRYFAVPAEMAIKGSGEVRSFVRFDDEYCIWDGSLSIQKRGSLKR